MVAVHLNNMMERTGNREDGTTLGRGKTTTGVTTAPDPNGMMRARGETGQDGMMTGMMVMRRSPTQGQVIGYGAPAIGIQRINDEYGEASQNSDNFEHGMTEEKKEEEFMPWKRREEEKENEAGKDDNLGVKVPIIKNDQPPLASLLGISSNEPPALLKSAEAAFTAAKYACPACGADFMKWSACMHHIVTDSRTCREKIFPDGKMPLDMTELQEKCKAKAAEMPKDVKKSKPEADASVEKQRRFQ